MSKTSWGLFHWETHENPTTSKTTYVDIKEVFLAKQWNFVHLSRKKLDCLHIKDFLKYECEFYLKQPLTPPQHKIIDAYRTLNHRLAIKIGRQMSITISIYPTLCHFCSYNTVENAWGGHFTILCVNTCVEGVIKRGYHIIGVFEVYSRIFQVFSCSNL